MERVIQILEEYKRRTEKISHKIFYEKYNQLTQMSNRK
jgi:hypothetical protein